MITKSISRFARNTVTLLETVRELKSLGIDVFFEEQNIHTLSAEGELMLTILASYAQEESRSASENTKWRIRKAFENGELLGLHEMFGYDIKRGTVRVNEAQASLVREIYRRVLAGDSFSGIARDFNERCILSTRGGRWYPMHIREIFMNEKYAGNALLQKKYRNSYLDKEKTVNRGELPMYYAENTHEAIIDSDTWERARIHTSLQAEKTKGAGKRVRTPFTSFIRCAHCGANYKRITVPTGKKWQCSTYQTKGKTFCSQPAVPEEILIRLTCEALSVQELPADGLRCHLREIRADGFELTFVLPDGKETNRVWTLQSRADAWTEEMKQKARERSLRLRRETE